MKRKKWSRKLIRATLGSALVVLTLYFVINAYVGVTYAIEVNAGQSGITIDQTDLFNITNIYPGQPAIESKQSLKVVNTGNSDFEFNITSELSAGDQRLFDILKLCILDGKGDVVYSGGLGNLEELTLATIKPGASKSFDFTLELPKDVDNSYQRLSTAFQFNIVASGDSSGGGGSGGNKENPDEEEPETIPPPEPSAPSAQSNPTDPSDPIESNEPLVPKEPIPQDPGDDIEMPDTGIPSRLPYYFVGLAAISAGLFLGLKRKS